MKKGSVGEYSMVLRPVVELACATWVDAERFIRQHVMAGKLLLPPTDDAAVGSTTVTVSLPSKDVLTFEARISRLHYDAAGEKIAMEIRFPSLSESEQRRLFSYAARLERGESLPSLPPFSSVGERRSGMRWNGGKRRDDDV